MYQFQKVELQRCTVLWLSFRFHWRGGCILFLRSVRDVEIGRTNNSIASYKFETDREYMIMLQLHVDRCVTIIRSVFPH